MAEARSAGVEGSGSEGFKKQTAYKWPAQGYSMIKAANSTAAQELMTGSPLGEHMIFRMLEKAEK